MFETQSINKKNNKIISAEYAFENNIVPLELVNDQLTIGLLNSKDQKLINDIGFDIGYRIIAKELSGDVLLTKLRELYPDYKPNMNSFEESISKNIDQDGSTIDYVNQIISGAIKVNASDIHLESLEKSFRVRYRIDGHLREISSIDFKRSFSISSRLKIMANLDISEKRRPQDGRIKFRHEEKDIDIRVSTLPTSFGEKIVLRILDKSNLQLELEKLGLTVEQKNIIQKYITSPFGMVLVTGPTGSGKTTTLYASLQHIHTPDKNILTIEDPVEYNLDGINQCNVKPDIGFDFAKALRSFLRQDPDVIMVGEIRDKETAEIAIRASLTGHLVFSTLHTNDAISGISRLVDMGVEPYLPASSVKLIIAQRLVRRLCHCKKTVVNKYPNELVNIESINEPFGCEQCNQTGYSGRIALYELFEITEEISAAIVKGRSVSEIRDIAKKNGFISLYDSGIKNIKNGITSYEEVTRETML